MGEQRPLFRFRLPWITAPPPPAPVSTPSPPQNEAPSATPDPNVKPMVPAQAPPLWSPKISAPPESRPQSQNSYQPTSPSISQSLINSQLPSPSLSSPQYSATSQFPSPSFTTPFSSASQLPSPQSIATSQPPSPRQMPSQEHDTSQLPSPKSAPRPSSPISSPEPQESSVPLAANARPRAIAKETPPHQLRSDDALVPHEEPKQKTMNVHSSGPSAREKEKPKVAFEQEHMQTMDQDILSKKDEATTSKHGSMAAKQIKIMKKPTNNKSTVRDARKKAKLSNGDRASFQEEIRNDISKLVDKMATANPENFKDEKVSIVALVGKNKGASMQLGFDSVRRGEELKIANRSEPVEGTKTKAAVNNNVQDINNSILVNIFITERSPGVHLDLHYEATELIMSYDKEGSPEALPRSLRTSPPPEGDP